MSKHYSLRSLGSFLKNYKWPLTGVFLAFIISNAFLAIIPLFIGQLVGSLAADPVETDRSVIFAGILIACSVGHTLTWHISEFIYIKYVRPASFLYENQVFKRVIRRPYPYFVNKFTGKISAYTETLGRETFEFIENVCYNYTGSLVRLVIIGGILTAVNWQTGLLFMATIVLMYWTGRYTIQNSIRYEKRFVDTQSNKTGKLVDAISNFVNVKSFQKEELETASIEAEQTKTITANQRSAYWSMFFWASMGVIVRLLFWPSVIIMNVYLFLEGQMSVAALTTLLSTIFLFSEFVWETIWHISQFNIRLARLEEAHRYLFGPINILTDLPEQAETSRVIDKFEQGFRLHNLVFAYPDDTDTEVISGINLNIIKDAKIGIVGKSGSGKTTLTKLLLGYYDLPEDMIKVANTPVRSHDFSQLVAYVPQDTSLFHRTIAENIAYASDDAVSHDQIVSAAKRAHAHEFIMQIPHNYDAIVGERGVKLSTGQRQRIAIARAFLDNKPILILDEATSALDSESEVLVQKALESLWHNKTVIAIAHRLSTLRNMDRIIVLDKGRIVEKGTHHELLAQRGKYAELWAHQSGGFLEE